MKPNFEVGDLVIVGIDEDGYFTPWISSTQRGIRPCVPIEFLSHALCHARVVPEPIHLLDLFVSFSGMILYAASGGVPSGLLNLSMKMMESANKVAS
jgi:hypothetical protein